jgi:predicted nucleic acid-binding protein
MAIPAQRYGVALAHEALAKGMVKTFTVDASVSISAFNAREPNHRDSRLLLADLQAKGAPIVVPTLRLPEVAATMARGRNGGDSARRFAASLRQLPHIVLVSLGEMLATRAANLAAGLRLRGSDAVYPAVAQHFDSTLVTLTDEQRCRVATVIPAWFPAEALAERALDAEK